MKKVFSVFNPQKNFLPTIFFPLFSGVVGVFRETTKFKNRNAKK